MEILAFLTISQLTSTFVSPEPRKIMKFTNFWRNISKEMFAYECTTM